MAAPALSTTVVYETTRELATVSLPVQDIPAFYHVDSIAAEINAHDFKTVALQFPDALLRDSTHVSVALQLLTKAKIFVLADTSYSPCCVDEIAAQHVNADAVFHFGNACLNTARNLPVFYVLHSSLDLDYKEVAKTIENFAAELEGNKRVLIVSDTQFTDDLRQLVSNRIDVAVPAPENATLVPQRPIEGYTLNCLPNRVVLHAEGNAKLENDDYVLVYVSNEPSESLLLFWSTLFEVKAVNAQGHETSVYPALRRRYRDVQAVKSAGTIGILVNTLSLADSMPLLERIKAAVTKADKKQYTFVVGKPNVAKLGNFDVVDVWVVLGCPQGGVLFGNDEYTKPIVTPYEIELAIKDEWTGKWLLNFSEVLSDEIIVEKKDEPLFDLITGKFVFNNTPLKALNEPSSLDSNSALVQSSNALTIRGTVSTAAEKLQSKSWTGLGSDHTDSETSAELKQGRSGIARNYGEASNLHLSK